MDTTRQDSTPTVTSGGPLKTQEVILLGGLVGGGLGAIVSGLMGRGSDEAAENAKESEPVNVRTETKGGDVHIVIEDGKKQADALRESLKKAEDNLKKASATGVQLSTKSRKDIEKSVSELTRTARELQERLADSTGEAPRKLAVTLQPVKEKVAPVVAERAELAKAASERLAPTLQTTTERARQAVERLPEIAAEAVEKGRHQAETLRPVLQETAKERLGTVSHSTADVTADLAKTAKELAALTKDQSAHLAETVRTRFPALLEQVEHALGEIASARTDHGADRGRHLTDDLAHQLEQVREWLASGSEQVVKSLEQTQVSGEKVREASKRAAAQTAGTTKEILGTIGWASAAGVIVYYGLLNESQRSKVRSFGRRAWSTARDVVQDLRGDDAEF